VSNTRRLVTVNKEKAEGFNNFFASVFTSDCSTHSPQVDGSEGGHGGSDARTTVSEYQVCNRLRNLNVHKTMGPKEMHPRA